jgi:hypothetical protein
MRGFLQRVVVVDCDLRAPSLHTITDSEAREGFIDMIKYGCSFFTAAAEAEVGGIYVISAGSHPVSSEEELMGRELEQVFHSLRAKADMTFVRMRPFLAEGRINPILECVDGVLLCVNRAGSRKDGIGRDFSRLWQSDVPVVGIVSQESVKPDAKETAVPESVSEEAEEDRAQVETVAPETEAPLEGDSESVQDREDFTGERESKDEPVASYSEDALPGDSTRDEESEFHDECPVDEQDVVETTLFGKKPSRRRLPLIIGICVVAAIMVILVVRQVGFLAPEGPEMDSRTTRSILLPGSDGVTDALGDPDEISVAAPGKVLDPEQTSEGSAPAGAESTVPAPDRGEIDEPQEKVEQKVSARPVKTEAEVSEESRTSPAYGMTLVHVSSFRSYENATRDSSRIAGAGLKISIALVEFEDLGTWYRVLVGPFEDTTDAEAAASKLMSLGLARNVRIISEGGME